MGNLADSFYKLYFKYNNESKINIIYQVYLLTD